jgi:hypothetical protein
MSVIQNVYQKSQILDTSYFLDFFLDLDEGLACSEAALWVAPLEVVAWFDFGFD